MALRKLLKILEASVVGAIIFLIGAFLVLTLIGLPVYGLVSFLLPLYFWRYVIFITPLGMMIGALAVDLSEKEKLQSSLSPNFIRLAGYIALLLAIIFLPFLGY